MYTVDVYMYMYLLTYTYTIGNINADTYQHYTQSQYHHTLLHAYIKLHMRSALIENK